MQFIKKTIQDNIGILNHITGVEKLEDFTMSIARKITGNAPLTVSLIKNQIHRLAYKTVEQLTNDEESRSTIEKVYRSKDFKEGKLAFIEKRKPEFKGE
jgi:methylmalonyl-CoA decarboxylase